MRKALKAILAILLAAYVFVSFFLLLPIALLYFIGIKQPLYIWDAALNILSETYTYL